MKPQISIFGAGFIGKNLVKKYLARGFKVKVLDSTSCPDNLDNAVEWVQGDFAAYDAVEAVVKGADVVFHLVSNSVPGDELDENQEVFSMLTDTLQLLRLCVQARTKRLVFISSSSVYGIQQVHPITESGVPAPISTHGIQKLTAELYLSLFKHKYGLDSKIMRLSNPFGLGQPLNGRQGFISIVIGNMLAGRTTTIRGDGSSIRDYIDIDDVLDACMLLAETRSANNIFNIGSGVGVSLNAIIKKIEALTGQTIPLAYVAARGVDIPSSILDTTLAKKELKFSPSITLDEGLAKYLKQNDLFALE